MTPVIFALTTIQWLWLMIAFFHLLCAGGWCGIRNKLPESRSAVSGLMFFNLSLTFGLMLVGLRGQQDPFLTDQLANLFILIAFLLVSQISSELFRRTLSNLELVCIFVLFGSGILYFGALGDKDLRVSCLFGAVSWICVRGSWMIGQALLAENERLPAYAFMAIGCSLGLTFVLRIGSSILVQHEAGFSHDSVSTVLLTAAIFASVFCINLLFAYIIGGRLLQKLHYQSTRDALTGIFNRGALFEFMQVIWSRYSRDREQFTIACLDIDFFKRINDNHGHAAGDTILRGVAQMIAQALRTSDVLGRTGGEEFVVCLPSTKVSGAQTVSERIRDVIERDSSALDDLGIQVTISIGIAEVGDSDASLEEVINRADMALYQAKNGGRNRVCVYQASMETNPEVPAIGRPQIMNSLPA